MSFCYVTGGGFSKTELNQGDVLTRTDAINALLKDVHPHFHQHNKNLYFMVLTQSCDLALHGDQPPKAPYITIAPIRPIDEVVSREVKSLASSAFHSAVPIMSYKAREKLSNFLRSLINNNVSEYFFLPSENTELSEDCCCFLRLPIAIKTDLHYQHCLDAKILQLDDSFQAKLGYLLGQIYSRVGTQDWDRKTLETRVKFLTSQAAYYIHDDKLREVEKHLSMDQAMNAGKIAGIEEIKAAERLVQSRKKIVLSRTIEIAAETLALDEGARTLLQARLQADGVLNTQLER